MKASSTPGRDAVAITASRPRSSHARRGFLVCLILFSLAFVALGTWQVKRLFWKLDLIARVDQRVHAAPQTAPGPIDWSSISAAGHEYLHVTVSGVYELNKTVQVQAATELGSGFWLLTPLRTADGAVYLINRGFVTTEGAKLAQTTDQAQQPKQSQQPVRVTGLLRISEPGGGFLRHNDPASDRWFSRDVQAIAKRHGLVNVAPFFIDAELAPGDATRESVMLSSGQPVAGLTVISFHNSHLVYAFTWYALALMSVGACFWVVRVERRQRWQQAFLTDQDNLHGKQG